LPSIGQRRRRWRLIAFLKIEAIDAHAQCTPLGKRSCESVGGSSAFVLRAARQATASLGGSAARFDASIDAFTESARAGTSA